jgi:protein TonB
MKFLYLFSIILFYYPINAQKTKETPKDYPTIKVHPKPVQEDSLLTVFTIAEEMPMLRDANCLKLENRREQKTCADQKLLSFIYDNINFPDSLRKTGLETVVLSFIIEADGSLSNFRILRDGNSPAFAQECIRVIQLTTEKNGPWVPARQRGQAIPLRMNLPFRLNIR